MANVAQTARANGTSDNFGSFIEAVLQGLVDRTAISDAIGVLAVAE
jgi:hypothetical protein